MALFTFLLRRSIASTRRKKASPIKKKQGKRPVLKRKPSSRKLYPVPVQKKKPLLSADGGIWSQIVGASMPGAKKMQFPFENIPPVSVNVSIEKDTRNAILGLGALTAGGIILGAILKRASS